MKNIKKSKKKIKEFFNFKKNKFSKKAVECHTEIFRLTNDLIYINSKINKSLILCRGYIELLNLKNKKELAILNEIPKEFKELRYHLENFCFRAGAYKDKLAKFVNQALELGYSDKEMGLVEKIKKNGIAKKSRLDTEFKKFYQNESLKWALAKRKSMAHNIYYGQDYHPLMMPRTITPSRQISKKILLKEWKENIIKDTQSAEKFLSLAKTLNDSVMKKINIYKKGKKITKRKSILDSTK